MRRLRIRDPSGIPDDVFDKLPHAILNGPICPNIRELKWPAGYHWDHVQKFFSPQLVSVSFIRYAPVGDQPMPGGYPLDLAARLKSLPTKNLERFEFGVRLPTNGSATFRDVSVFVERLGIPFQCLRVSMRLTNPAWGHLASLPHLTTLTVHNTPSGEIQIPGPEGPTFPALRRLAMVVSHDNQRWTALFPLIKSPLLEVEILTDHPTTDCSSEAIPAMVGAGLHSRVDSLTFRGFNPGTAEFTPYLGRVPFTSLKTFKLETTCGGARPCVNPATDSNVEQLAGGLPQLESLYLGHQCEFLTQGPTIKSMISLSIHCRSLKRVWLPFTLVDISEDVNVDSGEVDRRLAVQSSCTLMELCWAVTMPPQQDTEAWTAVKLVFRNLFPRLKGFRDLEYGVWHSLA